MILFYWVGGKKRIKEINLIKSLISKCCYETLIKWKHWYFSWNDEKDTLWHRILISNTILQRAFNFYLYTRKKHIEITKKKKKIFLRGISFNIILWVYRIRMRLLRLCIFCGREDSNFILKKKINIPVILISLLTLSINVSRSGKIFFKIKRCIS